ncbi:uncharacterized protein ACRADG_008333 [Cochliomyia hominivorax]
MTKLMEIALEASQPTFNLSLILATLWIINNDFAKYTTSALTIGQYAINQRSRLYHNDLINEIIKRAMITPGIKLYTESEIQENVSDETIEKNFNAEEMKRKSGSKYLDREKSIWFLDSITSYRNFEHMLLNPKSQYHRNGYFLIIYTGSEQERLSNVKEIFRRLFILYCTNVGVLLVVGKAPYLYTYFPFAKNKCHSSMPEFYISFRDIQKNFSNFEVKKPIFPSKVANMHGCELAVATWSYPPYVYVETDPESGNLTRLHGIEGSLLTLLSQLMNFKIRLKVPKPLDRGDVYPNGTSTGATRMIINAEANITIISMMYNKIRSEVMQPSYGYLYIPYVLAIPQGKKMTSLQRLIKPFRYIIWSCLTSSVMFGILFIYFLRFLGKSKLMDFVYGQGNRTPFTNLLSALFGVSVFNLPQKNFARYLLVVFLWYTNILRSAYSGALYNLLQDGRQRNSYRSINELVDNNFTFYAFPAVEKVFKLTFPQANTGTVDASNPASKLFRSISSSSSEKSALCLLEYSIRYYNQVNVNHRVDVLDQTVLTAPIVFYMPRHSYLRYRTDDLIISILSSGIINRYQSYYLYSSRHSHMLERGEPIKLTFQLLFALFIFYFILMSFAFLIFLFELSSLKSGCFKVFVDFLNF